MIYSSVLEAHIEVLQGLQKVSAYTEDMFNADEIDLHLTRQQERLLEEIVNKRFEDKQSGLDFIRPLIVKNKALRVFTPEIGVDTFYEPNMVYSVLPADYYHLVNDRSKVVTSTDSSICSNLTAIKTLNQLNHTTYISGLVIPEPTNTSAPYYHSTKIDIIKEGTTTTLNLPLGLNNIKSANSWFTVANYIRENAVNLLRSAGLNNIEIYWERFRDYYYPKSFIFVTTDSTISLVRIRWIISSVNGNPGGTGQNTFTGIIYKTPNYTSTNIPGYTATYTSNLLTETDEFYEQELNSFYKSKASNPKSQISDGLLMAYERPSFLISELNIDYIRKPRHISLALNQNFELGGDAPRIVVNRTTEFLKLAIENPTYKEVLIDNKTHNQI